jgi:hypothetical protein
MVAKDKRARPWLSNGYSFTLFDEDIAQKIDI